MTMIRSGQNASNWAWRHCRTALTCTPGVARSVSNYVYNHIGALATSHESLAKSLFLGGVTRRFPTLRFGFLEGGVAWACSLYAELLGHWSKRNSESILDLDPDRLDVDELMKYVEKYGDDAVQVRLDRIRQFFSRPAARPEMLDEFSRAMIRKAEDIRDRFVPNFYFGCEADDPLVAWAFAGNVNPLGRAVSRHDGIGYLALGCARYDRAGRGSLRTGRMRPHHRR